MSLEVLLKNCKKTANEIKELKIILFNTETKLNTIKENIDTFGVSREKEYTNLIENIKKRLFKLETKKEELDDEILRIYEKIDELDETRQKNSFERLDTEKCYEYSLQNGTYKYLGKFIEYESFKDGFIFYFEKKTFGVPKDSIEQVDFKEVDTCFEDKNDTNEEILKNRKKFDFLEDKCYEYSVKHRPYKYLGKFLNSNHINDGKQDSKQFNFEKKTLKIYYHDFPFIDIKECSCKRGFFSFFSRKDTIGGSIRQKRRRSKRKRTSKFLEIPLLYNKKKTLKR